MIHHRKEGLDLQVPRVFENSDIQETCFDLENRAAKVPIGRQHDQQRRAEIEEKRRINNQRLMVSELPIIEAYGTWKGKSCVFWVYGNDMRVYAPYCEKMFSSCCTIMFPVCF